MIAINPLLALIALAPAPFVVFTASRYNRLSRPALQEVQQRIAELTAEAEENVSGIRIVKAFAREEHQLHRFRRAVARVFDQSIYSTRLQAFFSPLIGLLPQLGIALVLLVGGREVIDGSLSLGDFTAFYTYLVMLAGADADARHGDGDGAAGDRLRQPPVRDPRPRAADREPARRARRCRPAAARVELRGRHASRYDRRPAARRLQPSVDLEVEAGQHGGAGRALGLGQDQPGGADRAALRPERGRGAGRRRRRARRSTSARCAREIAFVADDSFLFTASVAENIAYARPEATPRGDRSGGAAGPGRRLHPRPARRLRHRGRRARPDPLRRPAPAGRDRPRPARRPAHPDPRRRHLLGRRDHRGGDQGAACARRWPGRTTFIIAHRLSTVSLADEVVVMDGGRIVDRGTHEELLEGCGFYREIAEHGLADSVFLQRDLEEREEMARL